MMNGQRNNMQIKDCEEIQFLSNTSQQKELESKMLNESKAILSIQISFGLKHISLPNTYFSYERNLLLLLAR